MTTERERFEAWASGNTAKGADGNYESMHTATMWAAWQAALSAPPGYVLVPVEPTPEMLTTELGVRKWDGLPIYESRRDLRPEIWRAMIAAAPKELSV